MYIELFLLLVLVFAYLVLKDRLPSNMPPGPYGIPFLGWLPIITEVDALKYWRKYGDIVTVRTGSRVMVCLFDYKITKDVLGRAEFAGRPDYFQDFNLDDQKTGGVTMSNGAQWQHDRRFMLRNLRNLGMGKTYLEGAINLEAEALVEDLKKYQGEPINYPDSFRTAPLNIIWQMVASRRYDLRSQEVKAMYEATQELYKAGVLIFLEIFFPWIKKIPNFLKRLVVKDASAGYLKNMADIVDGVIEDHQKSFDPEQPPKDLIDEYLLEMHTKGREDNQLLRKGALRQIVADSFDAGSDTVNNILRWVVYLLVRFPEVAQKLRQEIDEVVPRDRMVSLQDKASLQYMEAFLFEVYRYSCMVILVGDHVALKDSTIEGYHIPKGTILSASIYAIQKDPRYWERPEEFLPERFMNDEGNFLPPQDGFLLFSSGRRQCPGEVLARQELFLFSSAIVQNFDVLVPEREELDMFPKSSAVGLRLPADNKLIYKLRDVADDSNIISETNTLC